MPIRLAKAIGLCESWDSQKQADKYKPEGRYHQQRTPIEFTERVTSSLQGLSAIRNMRHDVRAASKFFPCEFENCLRTRYARAYR